MTSTMDLVDSFADPTNDVKDMSQARAALEQRIKELEADAARYRFIREGNFTGIWLLSEVRGGWADGMDVTIDRAMSEAALQKLVDISQEYKLP